MIKRSLLGCCLLFSLVSCGRKGALYLPVPVALDPAVAVETNAQEFKLMDAPLQVVESPASLPPLPIE